MRKFLFAALLASGLSLGGFAQTSPLAASPSAWDAATAPVAAPPQTTTVLALAPRAPLPALPNLAAPLPATPQARPLRPNDGISTTRWVLGITSAVLALILAVRASK